MFLKKLLSCIQVEFEWKYNILFMNNCDIGLCCKIILIHNNIILIFMIIYNMNKRKEESIHDIIEITIILCYYYVNMLWCSQ